MKWIVFLLIAGAATITFAGERKSILRQSYVVISDVYSSDIPAGKCLVTGNVFSPEYNAEGSLPLPGARIATLDQKKSTVTDSSGKYKLLLDSKDTTIYMFYAQYEEIVIWKYQFQSQHVVTINFFPNYDQSMIEVDKPVIYLYAENPVTATVEFASRGAVTFTYPVYNKGWNVEVNSTGLYDAETGRNYPYLFWEAETADLDFKWDENKLNGFVIKTDTVVSFLESSLTAMGLNQTEQTDFITFWAPRMIAHDYLLVQFLTGADYAEKISSLTVTPSPDQLLRVYLLFSPLQSDHLPVAVQPQSFQAFERSGFTVVEWGGSELPPFYTMP